jgi:hypothetical protein
MERQRLTSSDDDLLGDLRRVIAELDPIPEDVLIAARAALDWRTLDAELAALVHDSVGEPALGVRGGGEPRCMTFAAADIEIEVGVERQGDGPTLRLSGQLVPAQTAQIAIGTGGGLVLTRADTRGRFAAAGVVPGPLRLRCWLDRAPDGGRLVQTAWLEI